MKFNLLAITNVQEGLAAVQDVQELAHDCHFGRYWQANPAHFLPGREPLWLNPNEADRLFFFGGKSAGQLDYPFPPLYLAALPQARLVGDGYIVVTGDHLLLADSFSNDSILERGGHFLKQNLKIKLDEQLHHLPFALYRQRQPSRVVAEPMLLLAHYWHFNYHHWLVECLPRLRYALELAELATCRLLVPGRMSSFQRESLDLLGVEPQRLLPFDEDDWRFERLYFPSIGVFSPHELGWLRQRLRLGAAPAGRHRFYISRRDAQTRRVLNEAELLPVLKRHGFETIMLAGRGLAEQMALFASAEIIMGAHGSGLTNCLFAPAGATLIELAPRDQINHCFWLLANLFDQPYTVLSGPVANSVRDFVVAPAQLEQLLNYFE